MIELYSMKRIVRNGLICFLKLSIILEYNKTIMAITKYIKEYRQRLNKNYNL